MPKKHFPPQHQKQQPGRERKMLDDASTYMTGQVLDPNGGEIVNG